MALTYKEHLLVCLAEEAGEVAQMASKVLRFYDLKTMTCLVGNDDPNKDNALECLKQELIDLIAIVHMLALADILEGYCDLDKIEEKKIKVNKYWAKIIEARKALENDK